MQIPSHVLTPWGCRALIRLHQWHHQQLHGASLQGAAFLVHCVAARLGFGLGFDAWGWDRQKTHGNWLVVYLPTPLNNMS